VRRLAVCPLALVFASTARPSPPDPGAGTRPVRATLSAIAVLRLHGGRAPARQRPRRHRAPDRPAPRGSGVPGQDLGQAESQRWPARSADRRRGRDRQSFGKPWSGKLRRHPPAQGRATDPPALSRVRHRPPGQPLARRHRRGARIVGSTPSPSATCRPSAAARSIPTTPTSRAATSTSASTSCANPRTTRSRSWSAPREPRRPDLRLLAPWPHH
jgi:hypothetical protein